MITISLDLYEAEIKVLIQGGAGVRRITQYLGIVGYTVSKSTVQRWLMSKELATNQGLARRLLRGARAI